MFKHTIGDEALKVIKTFSYTEDEDSNDWHVVMAKMEKHCIGEVNEIYERYCFNKRDKLPTESVDCFVAEQKTLAKTCKFCDCLRDSLICDRIVLGIKDEQTTKKLLRIRDLTLNRCIDIKKSSDLRVYIDPKPLNAVLKRERYQIPVVDDVLPDLAEARVFTKVDLASAFWQLELDDESSLLTTFATPHGRYRWLRLPFGLCVSSEIFQKHLNQELLGLPGVKCIANDVLIYGRDDADHDSCLEGLMKKCQQKGIKLNPAKLE